MHGRYHRGHGGGRLLQIVTFLWRNPTQWHGRQYSETEVNTLFRMIRRNTRVPFEAVCICDDPSGIEKYIRTEPLWDDIKEWGRCWLRLKLYAPGMRNLIGPRFMMLDLDTVITGNLDHLLSRGESFIGYACPSPPGGKRAAIYNGGMLLMDAGSRASVWTSLPDTIPETSFGGSDQAWASHVLGEGEATFGPEDGVYSRWDFNEQEDACMVHLTGSADPREWADRSWIQKHYR